MKKLLTIILFFVFNLYCYAQARDNEKRGTIKVRKTGQLIKVQYDNVNYRLIGIDRYGNVLDTAVVEFQMSVTIQGVFYREKAIGAGLTYQMQQILGKCDSSTPLFFKNIKAKDRYGAILKMPDFQYTLGNSDNYPYNQLR